MALNGYYCSGRFTQRFRRNYTAQDGLLSEDVCCLLFDHNNSLLAGTEQGLFRLTDGAFECIEKDILTDKISSLSLLDNNKIAIAMNKSLYILSGNELALYKSFPDAIVEFVYARKLWWILTENEIYCIDPQTDKERIHRFLEGGNGQCMAVSDQNIYIATETNISAIHGKRNEWKNILPAFSGMPDAKVHALSFDEAGYLWVGTDNGAAIYDNTNLWLTSDTLQQLPQNAIFKITSDKVGGRYFASDIGVIYLKNGGLKYFSADRWVPNNHVRDIIVDNDGERFFAATNKGITEISSCLMSLEDKADYLEDTIEAYHIRRGFVANRDHVENYDITTGSVHISDNDGLWTASNVAAESFRFGATGDPEALRKARRGMNALLLLTRVTEIPGFTARAVRYPGEEGFGDGNHEWVRTSDGTCEWKCETSSDEMTGHFFGFSVYYDLCATDSEKEEISTALCAIMDHIIDNNFHLVDHDGKPTTWAVWDPALLNNDDKWVFERGINSLELLAFLKVSYHVSGNAKYDALYKKLVSDHHYALNAAHHKIRDAHICHIDDNLGFIAGLTLLRLEDNASLRALYLCGMEDHWQYERPERQPMFSIIHAIFTGRDSDLLEGIQSLREYPLDLVFYAMENSKRKGLVFDTEQEKWHEKPQVLNVLPVDERNVRRPDGNPFDLDYPDYHYAEEGTFFLLPYWIGRYYGIIKEEAPSQED